MKLRNRLLVLLFATTIVVAVGARFIPAHWALPIVASSQPDLRYGDVTGTVWSGQADQVEFRGIMLGRVQWNLERIDGVRHSHWAVSGKGLDYSLDLELTTSGRSINQLRSIKGQVPAQWIQSGEALSPIIAGGVLRLNLAKVQFSEDGIPVETDGDVHWSDASIEGITSVDLGEIRVDISSVPGRSNFNIRSQQPAQLEIEGTGFWTAQHYSTGLNVKASRSKQSLLRFLESIGTRRPDGTLDVQFDGELARRF